MKETHDRARNPVADRIRQGLEAALGVPFTRGNSIDILRNGEEIFPAMLEAIRGATRRIEFLTFVYWTGDIAEQVASALADRAKAGVEVMVMLDGFGAKEMRRELIERMENAGARVLWFNPIPRFRVWHMDNRTHRKILVVDGKIGFTGGVGIAEEWQGAGDRPDSYRDNHFRIRGPAVMGLRGGFYADWVEAARTTEAAIDQPVALESSGSCEMQVVAAQANLGTGNIARLQDTLIRLAQRRVRLQTPYFSPSDLQTAALLEVRKRGVELEIMIPGPYNDRRISELAGADALGKLLEAGARLLRFQPTLLHSKTITVDGEVASVGTANFNHRSVNKDNELAVTVLDRDFTARMDAVFDDDRANCVEDDLVDWEDRGLLRRAGEALAGTVKHET